MWRWEPPLPWAGSVLLSGECSKGLLYLPPPLSSQGPGVGQLGPPRSVTTAGWMVRGCGLCRGASTAGRVGGRWACAELADLLMPTGSLSPTQGLLTLPPSWPVPAHLLAFPAEAGSRASTGLHPIAEPPSSWGQSAGQPEGQNRGRSAPSRLQTELCAQIHTEALTPM